MRQERRSSSCRARQSSSIIGKQGTNTGGCRRDRRDGTKRIGTSWSLRREQDGSRRCWKRRGRSCSSSRRLGIASRDCLTLEKAASLPQEGLLIALVLLVDVRSSGTVSPQVGHKGDENFLWSWMDVSVRFWPFSSLTQCHRHPRLPPTSSERAGGGSSRPPRRGRDEPRPPRRDDRPLLAFPRPPPRAPPLLRLPDDILSGGGVWEGSDPAAGGVNEQNEHANGQQRSSDRKCCRRCGCQLRLRRLLISLLRDDLDPIVRLALSTCGAQRSISVDELCIIFTNQLELLLVPSQLISFQL